MTTNPSLNAAQLNLLLVPKFMVGKSTKVQNGMLMRDFNGVRSALCNLFYQLQHKANKGNLTTIRQLTLLTNTGSKFTLSAAQQVSLFRFISSNRSTGLASLVFRAQQFVVCINRAKSRCINQP